MELNTIYLKHGSNGWLATCRVNGVCIKECTLTKAATLAAVRKSLDQLHISDELPIVEQ